MYCTFNKLIAVLAIALFCVAQAKGWNLFDEQAGSGSHGGSSGSSRSYHK